MNDHKSIAAALVAAQSEMGKALKQSTNPHFKSKYADLSNVLDAVLPALNKHGIALIQPARTDEGDHYVETVLIHAGSGETLGCRVPLIIDKNNSQGYASSTTYARRYGAMMMTGLAPEDDDGNAAAAAPPKPMAEAKFLKIKDLIEESGADEKAVAKAFKVGSLMNLTDAQADKAVFQLQAKIKKAKAEADDKIPDLK
tara:strand:+ start:32734 stop:33330 length:597 start_codon:yes stop_codon:yes gene_type:complete